MTITTAEAAHLIGINPPEDRRTITAKEAEAELGIPAGTIRGWASAGKLYAVSIGPDRQRWYLLAEVLILAEQSRRRTRHTRPKRRTLTASRDHIA